MQSLVEQGQELPEAERPTEPRAQPLLRVLRERLGEGRLAAELASGGMLTIEEALREALEP
jgi:hypothetical protein